MARLKPHPKMRRWLLLLGLSLAGSLLVQFLIFTDLNRTALMYWGLPWLVAVLLAVVPVVDSPKTETETETSEENSSSLRGSVIVLLGSSVLLREGFLCVLLFLPIYLFVIGLVALITKAAKHWKKGKSKSQLAHLTPMLLVLFALEGTHPNLSFERNGSVTVEQQTTLNRAQLWANLQQPMVLNRSTPTGLSKIFPQPYQIDIDSYEIGAMHKVHYRYARWFWTNVHEGSLELQIEERNENEVSARIVSNNSYLANYLELQRLTLSFQEQPGD